MKVLLIQDEEVLREKIVFALESTLGCSVEEASNLRAAKTKLKAKSAGIDLIVLDCANATAQDVEIFQESAAKIPLVLCSNDKATDPSLSWNVVGIIERKRLIENLVALAEKLVKQGVLSKDTSQNRGDYCRIRTNLLLSVCPLKGDVYIRLSDTKFIKLFRMGDAFEFSDMEKYTHRKGVEYFYIRKDETKEFIEKYKADLDQYLNRSYPMSVDDLNQINDSIYETVQELGTRLGFNKDVQALAKTHVRMTMKAMGKTPTLAAILGKLDASRGKYIPTHSTLTGYIACAIASQMEWGSETTFHKLNLAALLHDITIDNQELAACKTPDDANSDHFSEEDRKEFKEHPIKAAEIAKQFHEVPPDVDQIISQHHERPDGKGFPRGLAHSYISPLACIFIVAHDMAVATLRGGTGFKPKAFIASVREEYTSSQFRKILSVVENIT